MENMNITLDLYAMLLWHDLCWNQIHYSKIYIIYNVSVFLDKYNTIQYNPHPS